MDPRHPQYPYSRNNASPYSHAPMQQSQSQAPFPPVSHSPSGPPSYQEHQRRPSDSTPYYPIPPSYPRDGAPLPASNHSRQHSSSSVGHGTPVARHMPPPSSPQQQHQQHAQHQHQQHSSQYPPPTMSRGPPPSLGQPMPFPGGRDLPSLSSINRPGSVNSSMSISSMLGGPTPSARDSAPPASQYPPPAAMPVTGPPTAYSHSVHASPRISASAAPDFDRFRRPRTPEHRSHESVVRDHRANSAGSPPRAILGTPETQRYSTPQAYAQRAPTIEERRDQYPNRVPNPNAIPPRPSSQPIFNGPPARAEPTRMANDVPRQEPQYGRPVSYAEREREDMLYREQRERERERERQRIEEENAIRRDRERREGVGYPGPQGPPHQSSEYNKQYSHPQPGPYDPPHDPRDPGGWSRRPEPVQPEQLPPHHAPPPVSSGYEYGRPPAQSYPGPSRDQFPQQESRYPPTTYGAQAPPQAVPVTMPQYGSPPQERRGPQAQPLYHNQSAAAAGPYRQHESPRKSNEDIHQPQQRGYLGVQPEINRKGRNSPLPQAVQGAQGQIAGPGSEPGIKNEFGKMFSGIGSGVGGMGSQGGASGGTQTPFSNSGPLRREDLDSVVMQDSSHESGGHKLARSGSRGGGSNSRRRKLKDDGAEDDSSNGRRTPSGRKRPKTTSHPQNSGAQRQGTGHRYDIDPPISSPIQPTTTPFKGTAPQPENSGSKAPVPHHHHINRHHHHHHHGVPHPKPAYVPMPKPKQIVRSQAVLDSVSNLPRVHLGHMIYESQVVNEDDPDVNPNHPTGRGYRTKPTPLPRFEGKENCTYTIRVPRLYLSDTSREELTASRTVWGTDVYTDDSDVIAACIHSGWIRGAWPADVDVSLLGLDVEATSISASKNGSDSQSRKGKEKEDFPGSRSNSLTNGKGDASTEDQTLTDPPLLGPMSPIPDRDLHITILLLPALEKYASTVRFGIKSREWEGTHDGLSYMIHSMKWVSGVDTSGEARGASRRKRMQLRVNEVADEQEELMERKLGGQLNRENGLGGEEGLTETLTRESYIRGGPGPLEGVKGLGTSSWWKERPKITKRVRSSINPDDLPRPVKTIPPIPHVKSPQPEKTQEEKERDAEEQRKSEEAAVNGLAGLSEAAERASVESSLMQSTNGSTSVIPNVNGNGPQIMFEEEIPAPIMEPLSPPQMVESEPVEAADAVMNEPETEAEVSKEDPKPQNSNEAMIVS